MSIFCKNCGAENRDIAKFCSRCRENLRIISPPDLFSKRIKTFAKPEMILLPKGTFNMGSNETGEHIHTVNVDSFYPVSVSWYEAIEYCNWLSDRWGMESCYSGEGDNLKMDRSKNGYRLPTEAEWEYACRAGTTTEYYWGNEIDEDYCYYSDKNIIFVHPVGKKNPNSYGLFDMIGDVLEWCWDWYDNRYYENSPSNNPIGPAAGSLLSPHRVTRGCIGDQYRSAYRSSDMPGRVSILLGFRPVRSAL